MRTPDAAADAVVVPPAVFAKALARAAAAADSSAPLVSFAARVDRASASVAASPAMVLANATQPAAATLTAPSTGQTLPPAASADVPSLEPQIVQAIRLQWQAGVGQATIKLDPEHLGSLTVSLRVESGGVAADMRVETPAAEHWITAHESDLRSALERQGLNLDRMTVSQDGSPDRRSDRQRRPPAQQTPSRRAAPREVPEFTVAV